MTAQGSLVGEDFGQGERLTVRLRGLVRSYPRSVGIIKEFLQNADDAGATELRVIWDERRQSCERLPDPRMAALQGPALLFVNDQVFSDADFEAIRKIGESSKSASGPKTGRFGLGFNTSYNVTDFPSFVSGGFAVAFDPHRRAVTGEGEGSGRRWSLADLWPVAPDWLRGFDVGGLGEGALQHAGTIFRLPLRDAEQARGSEICNEPFGREHFDQIVRDLWELGDELILFARHVLGLRVEVIEADGSRREVMRIETRNREEVVAARAPGNAAAAGPILDNIVTWRAYPEALPRAAYLHVVEVRGARRELRPWQVSAGLFIDHYDELLKLAEQMVRRGEKAIPWAGAAVRLEFRGEEDEVLTIGRQRGRLACTFPLPEQPPLLPCNLNGCFDLDASRRQLSLDESVYAEADQIRVAWNRALLRHALPQAAALAIGALVPTIAELSFGNFYALWPDPGARIEEPWREFATGLVERLSRLPLVHARAGQTRTWERLDEVRLPPPLWGPDLQEALRDDGLAMPDPDVPPRLIKSAELAGIRPLRYRPPELRAWLQSESPLGVPLAEAPLRCLRERSHVLDLLQFCISDRKDQLAGLPLALTADGLVRTFGRAGSLFLADDPTRAILGEAAPWFIDRGVQVHTRLVPCEAAELLEMVPLQVVRRLTAILGVGPAESCEWDPEGADIPNDAWLCRVLRYLAERIADASLLAGLALFPDARGRLHAGGSAPLLVRADLDRPLRDALAAVEVDLVSGSYDLLEAARALHHRHPGVCDALAGASLARHLVPRRDRLFALPAGARERAALLDYLASPQWLDAYSDDDRSRLRSLPLWSTLEGEVIAAGDPRAFLAGGFRPPALVDLEVALVDVGPGGRWRALLVALGVPEMSAAVFLAEVLVPAYGGLSAELQRAALLWLRDDVDRRALQLAEPARCERARAAALIRGSDGELHPGHALHAAGEGDAALFGAAPRTPDMDFYRGEPERWAELFAWLGVRREPEWQALLRQVDAHVAAAAGDLAAARATAAALLRHLSARWPMLAAEEVLVEGLRERAWLLAVVEPSRRVVGFVAPEDRLYRPSELFAPELLDALAGRGPVLEAEGVDPRVLAALGLREPELPDLLSRLDGVEELWTNEDHAGLEASAVGGACAAIYGALGRLSGEVRDLAQDGRARVWDAARVRFWAPEQAFAVPVADLFGERRGYVPGDSDDVRRGLDRLGRRPRVEAGDVVAMLRELGEEGAGARRDAARAAMSLRLLRRLLDLAPEGEALAGLYLPTADGRILPADAVLVDDAPWFSGRIGEGALALVDPRVDEEVVRRLRLRCLSTAAREVLAERPSLSGEGDKRAFCRQLAETLHHPRFAAGLTRILANQGAAAPAELDRLLARLHIVATDRLVTRLRVTGVEAELGETEVPCFADVEERVVYVGGDHWDTVVVQCVVAIDRLLGGLLRDLAHVEAILRSAPEDIPATLDHRRVPRIRGEAEEAARTTEAPRPAATSRGDSQQARPARVETELSAWLESDVGRTAVARVVAFERAAGRAPSVSAAGHPAYDVQCGELRDPNMRMIRVIGLDGPWDILDAGLMRSHYNAGRTFGDHFWVYVVEHALDDERAKIHRLQNPVGRVTRFVFDARWRAQCESMRPSWVPQVGWIHHPEGGAPGKIEAVESVGVFVWLRVRTANGALERRFYRPGADLVAPEGSGDASS